MLPLANPLKHHVPPISVQTQSMEPTQHVPPLKIWLHALPVSLIAPVPFALQLPVKLLQIANSIIAMPMHPIAPMLSVRPPLVQLLPTAKSAQHLHRILNASTQLMLPLAKPHIPPVLPISAETPSMEITQIVSPLKITLHALPVPLVALMTFARPHPVNFLPTANYALLVLQTLNASTQLMLPLANPLNHLVLPPSATIPSMEPTLHVLPLKHWLHVRPMRPIALVPFVLQLLVKISPIVNFTIAMPMPPIAPMIFVRPPPVKLYQIAVPPTVLQTHLLPNVLTQLPPAHASQMERIAQQLSALTHFTLHHKAART